MTADVEKTDSFDAKREPALSDIVDVNRYPIDRLESVAGRALLRRSHEALVADGCASFEGFLSSTGLARMRQEASPVAPHAHRSRSRTNVYFSEPDRSRTANDPRSITLDRSNALACADHFRNPGLTLALYRSKILKAFVQRALGEPGLHEYADPLARFILQIFKGRFALHRVALLSGNRARHAVIFGYAQAPGMIGRVARTRQLYGKVLPVHVEAEKRARADHLEN